MSDSKEKTGRRSFRFFGKKKVTKKESPSLQTQILGDKAHSMVNLFGDLSINESQSPQPLTKYSSETPNSRAVPENLLALKLKNNQQTNFLDDSFDKQIEVIDEDDDDDNDDTLTNSLDSSENLTTPNYLYVENNISSKLICQICSKPLFQPQDLPCGHTFCRICLLNQLMNSAKHKCKICGKPFLKKDIIPTHDLVTNMLDQLEIYCPNKDQGCNSTFPRNEIEKHLEICKHNLVKCPNNGCEERFISIELQKHIEICPYRLVECPNNGCPEKIAFINIDKHLKECDYRKVVCEYCSEEITNCKMKEHLEKYCPEIHRKCPYFQFGCHFESKKKEMDEHLETCEYEKIKGLVDQELDLKNTLKNQNKMIYELQRDFDQLIASIDTEFLVKLKRKKILETSQSLPDLVCKNCNKKFNPRANHSRACKFHPGKYNLLNSGKWFCCGNTNEKEDGCKTGFHIAI